jgi:hypothetical protein
LQFFSRSQTDSDAHITEQSQQIQDIQGEMTSMLSLSSSSICWSDYWQLTAAGT